jgi:hypothetical protein
MDVLAEVLSPGVEDGRDPELPPRWRGSRAKLCRVSAAHWNSRA